LHICESARAALESKRIVETFGSRKATSQELGISARRLRIDLRADLLYKLGEPGGILTFLDNRILERV